ncbi:MAG: hypothetical protein ACLQF0_02035 [Dissulfurispiraceae bacterium]
MLRERLVVPIDRDDLRRLSELETLAVITSRGEHREIPGRSLGRLFHEGKVLVVKETVCNSQAA